MPKFRVTFPIDIAVRLWHSVEVEAEDQEIAVAVATIKTKRIGGEPNLFSYVCPNRDKTMRDFQIINANKEPFRAVTWANSSCVEVKDND